MNGPHGPSESSWVESTLIDITYYFYAPYHSPMSHVSTFRIE